MLIDTENLRLYNLAWDSSFFNVKSAKAILYNELSEAEFKLLLDKSADFEFLTIENRNSNINNSILIGSNTIAYLIDVNIQFMKTRLVGTPSDQNILISNNVPYNQDMLNLVNFEFSRFTEDQNLLRRNGADVHRNWVINSFDLPEKYFIKAYDDNGALAGFLLFSNTNDHCIIELIAVSSEKRSTGIGKKMFMQLENFALKNNIQKIKVGTQIKNLQAINFYHKVGCLQVETHQIYHKWTI